MERFRRIATLMLALAVVAAVAGTSFGHDLIVRVKDRKEVTFKEMVKDLKGAKVIYVGETHDNQDHHDLQLRIIQVLYRARMPIAIGMEMFTSASQKELDRWTAGTLSKQRLREVYMQDWSASWPLYRNILLFARKKRIPVIGLSVPREITRKVAREGFDTLSKKERLRLPPSITCDVDDSYMALIRRSYTDHDTNDAKTFKYFCEAQMLWNKTMAYTMLEYMKKNPKRTVVVITGSGHAVRGGMPIQVSNQNPALTSRVLLPDPIIPTPQLTAKDADYLWLSH